MIRKMKASDRIEDWYHLPNLLIDQLDLLAEATIKETRWGSAPYKWAREWQKQREDD